MDKQDIKGVVKINAKYNNISTDVVCTNGTPSFITGNTESDSFGTVRVPREFHNTVGKTLAINVILICKEGFHWDAQYDKVNMCIMGIEEFMKIHEVKNHYILLFDYVGDNHFTVKIYNTNGMESDFRAVKPRLCKSEKCCVFKESEYVVGVDDIEEEKAKSVMRFNGFRPNIEYYEKKIEKKDVARSNAGLSVPKEMGNLLGHGRDGEKIYLWLVEKKWELEIEERDNVCCFKTGWDKFAYDVSLEENDILIIYKFFANPKNYVCIIKERDINQAKINSELILSGSKKWATSFLHHTNEDSINEGHIGMPLLFEKMFYKLVDYLDTVESGGRYWSYLYIKSCHKVPVYNLIKDLNLGSMHTVIFTCKKNVTSNIRIFRKDGIEIKYDGSNITEDHTDSEWYMDRKGSLFYRTGEVDDMDTESETEYGLINGTENDMEWPFQFSETLISCHVDNHTHGVYIPYEFEPKIQTWTNETKVLLETDRGNWNIGINLTNGRKRFSAGWNKFVRENKLKIGDMLDFSFNENESRFVIDITRK